MVADCFRLAVYGATFFARCFEQLVAAGGWSLVAAATPAAFAGDFLGRRFMKKVTLLAVQRLVGAMLLLLTLGRGTGAL